MAKFSGAFTALITPMYKDGSIDFDSFSKLLKKQLASGIDGLIPLGTTAETPTLDEDEEEKILDCVFSEVRAFEQSSGKKIPVIVGAGSNNTRDAVRYVERSKSYGADAALVVTPYYNKPSDEGIFRHFEAVSKVGLPIVVYNIQGRTGKNIDVPTLVRISKLPNIVGVKEASGNLTQMMDVIAQIKMNNPDFSVLSGDDALVLPLSACGGDGVISVVSNLAPAEMSAFVKCCLDGDFIKAREWHYRLLPFFKAAFVDGNPSSIKYAMAKKGLIEDAVRLPLVQVHEGARKVIDSALELCGL